MSVFKELMKSPIDNSPLWDELSTLYDNYIKNNSTNNHSIPKKIHQIWLGGEVPPYYLYLIDSIKKNNPDWEYKLWTDKDLETYQLVNKDLFNSITNNGVRADLLRYEVLYNEGGVYLDIDFYSVKGFGKTFNGLEFFTSAGHIIEPECFNGLFGTISKHPLMKTIIDKLTNLQVSNEVGELYHKIGSKHFSREFFEHLETNKNNIVVFPTVYFYCYPALERHITKYNEFTEPHFDKIMSYVTPESSVIHFWHSNWM